MNVPQSNGVDDVREAFAIKPLRAECESSQYVALCWAIERLGGIKSDNGYVFASGKQRALAAELLGDRFGTRYFVLL